MKKLLLFTFVSLSFGLSAQVVISNGAAIKSTPEHVILDLQSDTGGLLIPRLTDTAIETLKLSGNVIEGMLVFNLDRKCFEGFEAAHWEEVGTPCIGSVAPITPVAFEGAFAFTGMRSSNPDRFSIITLVDIPLGEVFYLTDSGYKNDGTFRDTEGLMKWTVTQPISAREEISFESPQSVTNIFEWTISSGHGNIELANKDKSNGGGPSLTKKGENMIIFTATDDSSPYLNVDKFIAALKLEGPWNSNSTSTSTSAIPAGLVEDVTALALEGNGDNQAVDCAKITSGMTDNQIRAVLNDDTNWYSFPNSSNPIPTGCSY